MLNSTPAVVTIGFDPVPYSVEEDDGLVALRVRVISGVLGRPIDAIVTIEDGSATSTAPADFIDPGTVSISFDEFISEQQVFVTIIDDDVFENIEMFFANLVSFDPAVTTVPARAEVSISENSENNDRKSI